MVLRGVSRHVFDIVSQFGTPFSQNTVLKILPFATLLHAEPLADHIHCILVFLGFEQWQIVLLPPFFEHMRRCSYGRRPIYDGTSSHGRTRHYVNLGVVS
eukprot:Gb_33033 [translate_table: standard]